MRNRSGVSRSPSGELVDAALLLPCVLAAAEIVFDPGRRLVALLGRLREELHDDRGQRLRHRRAPAPPAATGMRATWQWTQSIGSAAVNGRLPVSIS